VVCENIHFFQCEEDEVLKEYSIQNGHQIELDRELETHEAFQGNECLLTSSISVHNPDGRAIGFIVKKMEHSLPNFLGFGDDVKMNCSPYEVRIHILCL
jgi:hypothetical protein